MSGLSPLSRSGIRYQGRTSKARLRRSNPICAYTRFQLRDSAAPRPVDDSAAPRPVD